MMGAASSVAIPKATGNAPVDDGGAKHLIGHPLPSLTYLTSTGGDEVDLFNVSLTRPVLVFIYPRVFLGETPRGWAQVPGASGCASMLTSVRDGLAELNKHEDGLAVYGLSTQSPTEQKEVVQRLSLPFPLLSDAQREWSGRLELPTWTHEGETYLKRMTLLLRGGQVTRVTYPLHPTELAARMAIPMLVPDEHLAPEAEN